MAKYKDHNINQRINIKSWLRGAYSLAHIASIDYSFDFWSYPRTKNWFEHGTYCSLYQYSEHQQRLAGPGVAKEG